MPTMVTKHMNINHSTFTLRLSVTQLLNAELHFITWCIKFCCCFFLNAPKARFKFVEIGTKEKIFEINFNSFDNRIKWMVWRNKMHCGTQLPIHHKSVQLKKKHSTTFLYNIYFPCKQGLFSARKTSRRQALTVT